MTKPTRVPAAQQINQDLVQAVAQALAGVTEASNRDLSTKTIYSKETETIILPEGMSKLKAADELVKQHENEEQVIELNHLFNDWMYEDVLVAFKNVAQATFGWIQGKTTYSFFGPNRPAEIEIVTDVRNNQNITELCFYGQMTIGPWEDATMSINVIMNNGLRVAAINVTAKKKFTERVRSFFKEVEIYLSNNSIYKGKSIVYQDGVFSIFENKPSDHIILNDDAERIISNLIIKPLGKEEKRSVLFSGPYGTGKTETAMRIGLAGNEKNLTFFYCKQPENFSTLLVLAKKYQPSIIFLEDVDDIGGGSERTTDLNDLLNTLDGVQTKNHSLTCIFTTNHAERINKALRRPGRIDVVVQFGFLTKDTIAKIYKKFFENKTTQELDYNLFAESTPDEVQGAIVAEMAKRALQMAESQGEKLNNDIVLDSIISMKHQIEFLKGEVEITETTEMKLANSLASIIDRAVQENPMINEIRAHI